MDARSNLARFLVFYAHMSQDDAEHMVQQALNEELHEAAEKIRERWDYLNRIDGRTANSLCTALCLAADLIDPEKETS